MYIGTVLSAKLPYMCTTERLKDMVIMNTNLPTQPTLLCSYLWSSVLYQDNYVDILNIQDLSQFFLEGMLQYKAPNSTPIKSITIR